MYLDLLNSDCFPSWPSIFSIAERVLHRLSDADSVLEDHISMIASVNPLVNIRVNIIMIIYPW